MYFTVPDVYAVGLRTGELETCLDDRHAWVKRGIVKEEQPRKRRKKRKSAQRIPEDRNEEKERKEH